MNIPEQTNGRIGFNCGVHFESSIPKDTTKDMFLTYWYKIFFQITSSNIMPSKYKDLRKFGFPGIFVSTVELPIVPDDGLKIETVKTRNGDLTVYMRLER